MELGVFERREIQKYFALDKKIEEVYKRIESFREYFYSKNMFLHTEFPSQRDVDMKNNSNLMVKGFNIEMEVINLVDNERLTLRVIELLKDKKRYFNDYLNSLDAKDRECLLNKYCCKKVTGETTKAEIELYSEILEINEAISYMYGYPPDEEHKAALTNEESFLDDFSAIANLLEV